MAKPFLFLNQVATTADQSAEFLRMISWQRQLTLGRRYKEASHAEAADNAYTGTC